MHNRGYYFFIKHAVVSEPALNESPSKVPYVVRSNAEITVESVLAVLFL